MWKRFVELGVDRSWAEVEIDDDKFELSPWGDLSIKQLQIEDSGRYVCYRGNSAFEAIYYMDVVPKEPMKWVRIHGHLLTAESTTAHSLYYLLSASFLC